LIAYCDAVDFVISISLPRLPPGAKADDFLFSMEAFCRLRYAEIDMPGATIRFRALRRMRLKRALAPWPLQFCFTRHLPPMTPSADTKTPRSRRCKEAAKQLTTVPMTFSPEILPRATTPASRHRRLITGFSPLAISAHQPAKYTSSSSQRVIFITTIARDFSRGLYPTIFDSS